MMRRRVFMRIVSLMVMAVPVALAVMPVAAFSFNPGICADYDPAQGQPSPDCIAMMEAFPEPTLIDIPKDLRTLSSYSYWRVGPHAVNTYDSPNGSVIGQIPEGFNFVVAIDTSVDGWVQIQGGEWLREADVKFYEASFFSGALLLNGLDYPFAWVMDTMFTSDYPGGPQSADNGRLLYRYDRVNIFAEAQDDSGWVWYMIGPDQWIDQRLLALAKKTERPEGVSGRWVAVDLYEQTLVGYEDDTPVFATLISSGLPNWDTNEGIFTIWARVERDGMSGATGAPDAYALQSVPWTMYFDKDISLHGTYWHDGFGYRHSHGCVNLSISDASYLFDWTAGAQPNDDGEIVNQVYVYSSGEYGTP